MSARRVHVRCTNEACRGNADKTSPWEGQRSAKTWTELQCPRCSSSVELAPGVDGRVAPRPRKPNNRFDAPSRRSIFQGMRIPRVELSDPVHVTRACLSRLQEDPAVTVSQRVQQVLEEWSQR